MWWGLCMLVLWLHPLDSFLGFFFLIGCLTLWHLPLLSGKTAALCLSSYPLTPDADLEALPWAKMCITHAFQRLCPFLFLLTFGWFPVFLDYWGCIYYPEFIIVIVRSLVWHKELCYIQHWNTSMSLLIYNPHFFIPFC